MFRTAQRISKMPSYRAYAQKYPYDGAERPYSLDYEVEFDGHKTQLIDLLSSNSIGYEPAQIDAERVQAFKATLSPRQKEIAELLEKGYKPKDIAAELKYKNTGGVRYLKWAIKKKYVAFCEVYDG